LSTAGAAESRQDASWVTIDTPLGLAELRLFCGDVERLYRINPYLEIQAWRPIGANEFRVTWRNLSNDQAATLELRREVESENEFSIACSAGIKRRTRFSLEPAAGGSRLVLTDDYASLPEEGGWADSRSRQEPHGTGLGAACPSGAASQDQSGVALAVRRFWLPMRPAAQRIAVLIVLASRPNSRFFSSWR
jgi:hypothetical protein